MRNLYFLILFTCLSGNFTHFVYSQPLPQALTARLQFVLDSCRTSSQSPVYIAGFSAAVDVRNVGIWTGVSGQAGAANPNFGVPAALLWQDTMRSRVYSVTKSFTASIILMLMAEGRLSLDDTIGRWIDTLVSNPLPNIRNQATIRQCLTHATGHGDYVTSLGFILDVVANNGTKVYSPREAIGFTPTPLFALGASRSYSSTNYILLGMVAEGVTDSSIHQLFRSRIFQPLALNNTYLAIAEPASGFLAHPHDDLSILLPVPSGVMNIQNVFPFTSIASGAWATGAIVSTAADIAKYARNLYGGTLLPPSAYDSMLRSVDSSLNPIPVANYNDFPGYGVFNNSAVGAGVVGHGGSATGYKAFMYGNPQNGINISILCNQQPASLDRIGQVLYESVLAANITGIEESHQEPIQFIGFYPNPAEREISLQWQMNRPGKMNISIRDMKGNCVDGSILNQWYASGLHQIILPLPELAAGLYLLQLETEGMLLHKKLVIR